MVQVLLENEKLKGEMRQLAVELQAMKAQLQTMQDNPSKKKGCCVVM